MKYRIAFGALALTMLAAASGLADPALKSGLPVGSTKISPFNPLHCNGPQSGTKACLVWKNGGNPVAMIFAREVSDPLTSLVKKIDAATASNSACHMGSFVVFLSDAEGLKDQLEGLAKKVGLKHTVLSIDNPAGPRGYGVAKEADVTVVLYTKRTVKSNFAFRKGELNAAAVDRIIAALPEILPEKK